MAKKGKAPAPEPAPEQAADPDAPPPPEPVAPLSVVYCAVCTYPPEYCEFGASLTRCKEWLKEEHPDLFDKYYSEEALQTKAQTKLEKDMAKKEVKAEAKAEAALKKKMASQIIIKRIERTKRKHITSVFGLEAFGIDLKKAAKQFASKFATGASVSKNPQGLEEIVVSGDVSDEILEMIENEVGVLKGIPADNVELVEEKKKKSAE
ncbi:translation initiation factor SUI1 [Mycena olivaceomarginata]|nr:translation initiation factor SUI1 [Mycena olivaceomarginata]